MRLPRLPRLRLTPRERGDKGSGNLPRRLLSTITRACEHAGRVLLVAYRPTKRAVIILAGLAVFFGAQYWLAGELTVLRWWSVVGLFTVLLCAALVVARPMTAFLFWLLLSPIVSKHLFKLDWGAGIPALTFDRCLVYPLAIILLIRALAERRPAAKLRVGEILVLAFPLYITLCAPFFRMQSAPAFVLTMLGRAGDIPILYFVTKAVIKTQKDIARLVAVLIAVGIYSAAMGFYDHFTGKMALTALIGVQADLVYTDAGGRAAGPFIGNPAELGMFLGIAVALAIHVSAWTRYRSVSAICWIGVCLMLASLFWTYTRGSYLVFGACAVLLPFIARGNRKGYAFALAAVAVAAIAFLPAVLTDKTVYERLTNDRTTRSRIVAAAALGGVIKQHPIFGVGINNAHDEMPKYATSVGSIPGTKLWFDAGYRAARSKLKVHIASHSTCLTILAEQGIIGFTIYMGAFAAFLVGMARMRRAWAAKGLAGSDLASVAMAAVLGFLLSINTTPLLGYEYVYCVIWVLIAAVVRVDEMRAAARVNPSEAEPTVDEPARSPVLPPPARTPVGSTSRYA